ncbi:MAG: pilus assembly protein [Acidimicrobiia bacterium]|nr:pilus assembly protein [Acidimicrobiia bacterium]
MNKARTNRSRRSGERGAALVEFALVATILSTFVLGIFEIGMAWSDHQSLTQASRSGARVGSQLGTLPEADNEALRAIEAGVGAVDGTISRIVIFEADANGNMPAPCVTATAGYSGAANCNVYDAASLATLGNPVLWGSGSSCGPNDGNWCSVTDRDDTQQTATYVGVHVEFQRDYLTGFFGGGTHTMAETTVMRIEPGT